jgi:hypothetical protein
MKLYTTFVVALALSVAGPAFAQDSVRVTQVNLSHFVMLDKSSRLVCRRGVAATTLGSLSRKRIVEGALWRNLPVRTRDRVRLIAKEELTPGALTEGERRTLRRMSPRTKELLVHIRDTTRRCDDAPKLNGSDPGVEGTLVPSPTATPTQAPGSTSPATPTPRPTATHTPHHPGNSSGHGSHHADNPTIDTSHLPKGTEGISTAAIEPTQHRPHGNNSRDTFRTRVAWTHYSYNDPIVFPGKQGAAHLHLFFGNALVDHNTTSENIRTKCRSSAAGGTANCSGYWIPALLDKNERPLPPDFSLWYYKAGYGLNDATAVRVPPVGLKMVAGKASGNPSKPQTRSGNPLSGPLGKDRIFDSWGDSSFFGWNCTDDYRKSKPYIPADCPAGSILTLSLTFPICWNGRDLDSADHISHMSDPVNGACPASHPVPIPTITLNIEWEVPQGGTSGWHLSSDMYPLSDQNPGGFSTHADWFNGWDPAVFERFNNNCNRRLIDCGVDNLNDGFALSTSHQKPMRR